MGRELAGHPVPCDGAGTCPLHPTQPDPASSLEVPVVVLSERLQDNGDDRHEGFHDAELQRGLHRGRDTVYPGQQGCPTTLPAAPATPGPST